MTNLERIYTRNLERASDMNEHLPTLRRYAESCEHVTEMGVRCANSTYALMLGQPTRMVSIDLLSVEESCQFYNVDLTTTKSLYDLAKDAGVNFEFVIGDTRTIEIEPTDLLFIDTLHTYTQLKRELELHSGKVRKFIILHDTTTFGESGEPDENGIRELGLWPAVEEFLNTNCQWEILERFTNNNGLTILNRKPFI